MNNLGEIKISLIETKVEILDCIDWILTSKSTWHERSRVRLASQKAEQQAFSHQVATRSIPGSEIVIHEIKVSGSRVAASICFRKDKHLDGWMLAWSPEWRKISPGRIIVSEVVQWAFEHGIEIYDLGPGGNDYKYRFTDIDDDVLCSFVVALRPFGRIYLWIRTFLRLIRHFVGNIKIISSHIARSNLFKRAFYPKKQS